MDINGPYSRYHGSFRIMWFIWMFLLSWHVSSVNQKITTPRFYVKRLVYQFQSFFPTFGWFKSHHIPPKNWHYIIVESMKVIKLTGFHRGSPWFTCSFSWCKVIYGSFIQAVTYLGDWNSSCTREMNPARNFDNGTLVGGLSQLGFSETIKTVERQWPPTNCYMYWKNVSP